VATIIAAVRGSCVRSLPSVSSVRRAMVSAPTPTATEPKMMPMFMSRSPLPTSGAMALAMFDVPAENAIRQPMMTTMVVPMSSR
jgi:hypothetical protein